MLETQRVVSKRRARSADMKHVGLVMSHFFIYTEPPAKRNVESRAADGYGKNKRRINKLGKGKIDCVVKCS